MKLKLTIILLLFASYNICSQSQYASIDRVKTKKVVEAKYDGSSNYLKKNVYWYIGQILTLKCDSKPKNNTSGFILGFTVDYKIKKDQFGDIYPETYHPSAAGLGTDFNKIEQSTFKVLDVYEHPWANRKDELNEYKMIYFLKMHNLTLNDTVYYEYFASDKNRYFPFYVSKHLEYLEDKYVGTYYQLNAEANESIDVKNAESLSTEKIYGKSWWKCTKVCTDPDSCKLSLILQNNEGTKIIVSIITIEYLFIKIIND